MPLSRSQHPSGARAPHTKRKYYVSASEMPEAKRLKKKVHILWRKRVKDSVNVHQSGTVDNSITDTSGDAHGPCDSTGNSPLRRSMVPRVKLVTSTKCQQRPNTRRKNQYTMKKALADLKRERDRLKKERKRLCRNLAGDLNVEILI